MDYKYDSIILNKTDVGETDRIYTFYSREKGKISLVAKGVRKPNARLAGNLEPLGHAEIFAARSRGRGNITGAIGIENFENLKNDIGSLEKAFRAIRIFNKLMTQEEKDEKIFVLLLEYLRSLEKSSALKTGEASGEILTSGFIFKLLDEAGYRVEMRKCAFCRERLRPGINYFSPEKGGVVSPECAGKLGKKIKISDESIKLVRIFLENKMENLAKIKVGENALANLKLIAQEAARWAIG